MSTITRFFSEVTVPAEGLEIPDILGGVPNINSGTVEQIIIEPTSGGGNSMEVQIRYEEEVSSRENLVYWYTEGDSPFVDSNIGAGFSLNSPTSVSDLALFILPEQAGVFEVRIDIKLDRTRNSL